MNRIFLMLCILLACLGSAAAEDTAPLSLAGVRITEDEALRRVRARSPDQRVYDVLGPCGDPCRISHGRGGSVVQHEEAGKVIAAGAKSRLEIDGPSYSACAILADLVRYYEPHKVCITPRATFHFHKTTWETDPPQSPAIHRWAAARKGYPSNWSGRFLKMNNTQALKFWLPCETPVPRSRPVPLLRPRTPQTTIAAGL